MVTNRVVGRPTPRVDGEYKVTGKAAYAVDVVLPDMLWAKVLRSPIPYGKIKRIDVSKARQVAGVKTIITGEDVTGLKIGRRICDMPILADGLVRFIGEKVAAVAAETEEAAEQAINLIDVEYEDMEPVLDSLEAIQPTATVIHPDVVGYKGLPVKLESPGNTFVYISWKKGDLELGLRQSDVIVENTFTTNNVHHAYIEPHSCVAKAEPSGAAEIWSCSKVPYVVRDQVATAVRIDPEKLVIHPCYIGGDFGGKGDFMDMAVCYFLSLKSGRPVKIVMEYEEEFTAGNPRHSSIIRVRTGVKKDGTLVAHHMEFIFDSGAYGAFKPNGLLQGPRECPGPYKIPHALVEERMVYTNKIPCGHMRAPGDPQGAFANESQMDLVARRLGIDPAEFRRKNLMRDGDDLPTGGDVHHIKAHETLELALREARYFGPKSENTGRGIAVTQWLTNGGEGAVAVTIEENGEVTVASAMLDQGVGTYTVLSEIVAQELQVPLHNIHAISLDTKTGRKDTGVGGSRATRVYGNAAYQAAISVKEEIKRVAAKNWGGEPEDVILADGGVLHRHAERRASYGELVKAAGAPIRAEGYYNDRTKVHDASMCAQVAEVEVDPDTGQVKLKKFTSAHHTGTVLNPLMHQGQIEGGSVMGMGYALMEHLMVDAGRVVTANFGDYKIPTIQDIPDFKSIVMEAPTGSGPYNSMAIGETAIIPVAAAVANAVEDAVGVRIKSLPITSEEIFNAMKKREGSVD